MRKSLVSFICATIFTYSSAEAQTPKSKIEGTITRENGLPAAANLSILTLKDSLIRSIATDSTGKYRFELDAGKYRMEIKSIGFKTIQEWIDLNPPSQIKNIILVPDLHELETIQISVKKPLIERFSDKTVLNVENNSIATGNSAFELLAKVPGVSINQGAISIKGRTGVHVLIDGKSTYLSAEQLVTRLKSLSGDQLKSIELITNPSAKYDAEGNAGIINIKLKKNAAYGTNGNLDAGFGYGKDSKSNAAIALNHRTEKFNVFGSFFNNNNTAPETLDILRIDQQSDGDTYFHQSNTQVRTSHNNNYKAGLDYFINGKNTVGFLTTGYFNNGHDTSIGRTNIGRSFSQIDSAVVSDNPASNSYRNQAYNLNYKSLIDTSGQEFSIDLDYARYRNEENTLYTNAFVNGNEQATKVPSIFRNTTPSLIRIWAIKMDYSHPFNSKTRLDVGLKSSWVQTDNDFRFENSIGNTWQNDPGRSNRFVYDENINAAYALFKHEFPSTSLEIGLRAEQTNSNGNSISEQKVVNRSYLNFFPSLSLNQKLSENNELGISFSRRIERPDYKSLNPFVYFVDLYTFSQGNPFLNPQYTNAVQLTYSHKQSLNITLAYSKTKDLIMDVLLSDPRQKALYQTEKNLAQQQSVDLTIGIPTQIFKFWSMDNTLTTTYNKTISPDVNGLDYNRNKLTMMFNSNHSFTLSPTISADLTGEYSSSQIYGTYAIKPYYGIDFGLKKTFLNQKLNLKFALNDVLNSRKARISSALSNLNYNLVQKQESRVYRLSINYIFGSSSIKSSRERKTSVAEEEGRIK